MAEEVTFRVFRGEPDDEGVPCGEMVDYTVALDEGMVVLDVIHRIQAEQAAEQACNALFKFCNCKTNEKVLKK